MNLNLRSSDQIGVFLYDYLKLEPIKWTSGGKSGKKKPSTDEQVIIHYAEKENIEFCKYLLQYRKLEKARGTYIADIKRHLQKRIMEDKLFYLIHPDFSLNIAETFRSSASGPNLQNQPHHGDIITIYDENGKRDKHNSLEWKIIRKVIKCRGEGWLLAEVDYQGSEVKGAANLSEDQQLIDDLNNDMDMHSHWTNVIFGWDLDFKTIKEKYDEERHVVKNNWTFANFFGAGPSSIAKSFRKFDVYKNFAESKFKRLKNREEGFHKFFEEFSENHFSECQEVFFERYNTYKAWQNQLVKEYYINGYVETPLGFRRYGPLKRNEILNFPIQATSYHLLQNALNEAQKEIISLRFKSNLCGQIHDSGLSNLKAKETIEFTELIDDKMINHNLPICKKAKLGTDWKVGKDWLNMRSI